MEGGKNNKPHPTFYVLLSKLMSESEKQFEQKEELKRVVKISWGEYEDRDHELLRIPEDWDLDKMKDDYYKGEDTRRRDLFFADWLIEKGAREFEIEEFSAEEAMKFEPNL